jgi:hypothetical protein
VDLPDLALRIQSAWLWLLHDAHYVDALGTGADQPLSCPAVSGNPAPPGAIDSVTNPFLGTGPSQNDFAIAVSQEYVKTKFAPTLELARV